MSAPAPTSLSGSTTLRDLSLVVAASGLAGAVGGLVWAWRAPYSFYTRFEQAVGQGQLELSRVWYADGWFALIAIALGLIVGLGFGFRRRMDPLAVVVGVLLGSALGVVLMAAVGVAVGPVDPTASLMEAAVGTTAGAPLSWPPLAVLLAWPVGAIPGVLVGLFTASD